MSPLASPSPHSSGPSSLLSRPASLEAISVNSSSDTSTSGSESTQGSDDDVALLPEPSAIMVVDDHSSSLSSKLGHSPPQKRRLKPSRYPVVTDYFTRRPSEKKKRSRKRGIVPSETASRSKRSSGKVRTSGNDILLRTVLSYFLNICLLVRYTACGPARFQNPPQAATRTHSSTSGPFRIYGCGRADHVWVAEKKCGHHRHGGYRVS